MFIKKLDYEKYKGRKYQAEILSDRFLSIEPEGDGFDIRWIMSDEPLRMSINDDMLQDWLDHPVAYGAFEGDRLLGFVEGFLEKWNNRYTIANICVFDSADRRNGVGTKLIGPEWPCLKRRVITSKRSLFTKRTVFRSSDSTGMLIQTVDLRNITCGLKWARNYRIRRYQ